MRQPPKIPFVKGVSDTLIGWLQSFRSYVADELATRPSKDEAINDVKLIAPDGSVWLVTVDNTGALVITKMVLGGGL